MDTSLNRSSNWFRRLSVVILMAILFGAGVSVRADFRFAEELFPELAGLIEMAVQDGVELQLNELRLEEREGDLEATRGQGRPQVHARARLAGAYETRDDIDDRYRGNVNANLTVTQPVFHWGAQERRVEVAEDRMALESLESSHRGERHIMEIRIAYLRWLLMQQRREVLQQSISLSESFVKARRQLVEAGQSSEQDLLEMEARLLENHEHLSYIEKGVRNLEGVLERLVGPGFRAGALAGKSLAVIEPMDQAGYEKLADRVRSGLSGLENPEIERFAVLEDIEAGNLAILDKENHPKVDFVAGILSDHLDGINEEDFVLRIQYYAGLQVNWNIFNGWQTKGWKRSALARKRAFALQEEAARDEVRRRAEALLAELQLNLRQIEARSKRADILERREALVREQVDRALLPGSERIEVEIDYHDVRQRLMEARVNYIINLMELGILMGQDPAQSLYRPEA